MAKSLMSRRKTTLSPEDVESTRLDDALDPVPMPGGRCEGDVLRPASAEAEDRRAKHVEKPPLEMRLTSTSTWLTSASTSSRRTSRAKVSADISRAS